MKYCLFVLLLLFFGCTKKFKTTFKICNDYYAEVFNKNPAGVGEYYLTDSVSFRVFIGDYDEDHEFYKFKCDGDSIFAFKFIMNDKKEGEYIMQERSIYNITKLKKVNSISK